MNTSRSAATSTDDSNGTNASDGLGRRKFVAVGVGVGTTLLAGCAGDDATTDAGGSESAGGFRLLISDQPADIGDFERLDVTLDSARIFESGGDEADDDEDESEEEADDEQEGADDEDESEEEADDEQEGADDAGEDDEEADDEQEGADDAGEDDEEADDEADGGGFRVIDLDGATVDLTEVIGEDAVPVFEGELPEGRYEKIELDVADVEGIVEGEEAEVKVPSEKLQITNSFEVSAEEPVDFVFDINVVKRGPENGYILQPVISESGVAGRDVDVNEIDPDADGDGSEDDAESGDENGEEGGAETGDENAGEDGGADDENGGTPTEDGSDE